MNIDVFRFRRKQKRKIHHNDQNSTKRLVKSQEIAEKRRAKKKRYQQAIEHRQQADQKNVMEKVEKLAADDPNVAPTYDLSKCERSEER